MMGALRGRWAIISFASAGMVWSAYAQHPGGPAGDFNGWVLALEWQPGWNLQEPHGSVVAQTTNTSYAATHLSLHGLWPQFNTMGYGYPMFCKGGPQGDFTACEYSDHAMPERCYTSEETIRQFNTSELWGKFALEYAFGTLSSHEWSKHGGCTGWDQATYFGAAATTLARVQTMSGPQFLTQHAGTSVALADLKAAFSKKPMLTCAEDCYLTDVLFMLTADANKQPVEVVDAPGDSLGTKCNHCDSVYLPLPTVPAPSPAPSPSPGGNQCIPDVRGPPCVVDISGKDPCLKLPGCVRCSHHGFCTDVPLPHVVDVLLV